MRWPWTKDTERQNNKEMEPTEDLKPTDEIVDQEQKVEDPGKVEEIVPDPNSEEFLRTYALGIAAREGWSKPEERQEEKVPCYPGTKIPLPSNYDNLEDDTKIALAEMAANQQYLLDASIAQAKADAKSEVAPILRQSVVAQMVAQGASQEDADAVLQMVERVSGGPVTNVPSDTIKIFGLAAKGLAKERPKQENDAIPPKGGGSVSTVEADEIYAAYEKQYGKKPSDYMKKELLEMAGIA